MSIRISTRIFYKQKYSLELFKLHMLVITLIFFGGMQSCKKGPGKIDVSYYWQCHAAQNLDSADLASNLAGSWIWKLRACYWTQETTASDRYVKVSFNTDGTCIINDGELPPVQGSWKLKRNNNFSGNYYNLSLEPFYVLLRGRILLCNQNVLFNDSYIDGCDNLFTRE